MAYDITTHSPATGPAVMLAVKTRLTANGWTVVASSDGITYNGAGDAITTASTGAGGWGNDWAWALIVDPDGIYQWLYQRQDSDGAWNVSFSPSAAFSGGNATTAPTAPDAVGVYSTVVFAGSGPYDLTVGVQTAAPWASYWHSTDPLDPSGEPEAGVMHQPLASGVGTNPSVAIGGIAGFPQQGFATGASQAPLRQFAAMMVELDAGGGGGGDTTPPVVGSFVPDGGSTIARTDSIAVNVSDETALEKVFLWGELADGTRLLVYDGTAFVGIFATSSTHVSTTFTVVPDAPGWPSDSLTLAVVAIDTSGNTTTATATYGVSNAPAAPTVGPFSPLDGGSVSRTGTITIDVTDDEGRTAIANVQIAATLASGQVLTVYNGSAFPGPFAASSARSNITNGYRYSIVHDGAGWPSSTIAFRITAIDAQGRTTTDTSYNLTVSGAPTAPTIGSWSPSAGAVSRTVAVGFEVTSPDGFASITVWSVLADGSSVIVYDGAAFGGQVDAGSSVSGTTTKSFTVVYDGAGWLDDYTLHVRATSALGLTATATQAYTLTDAPAPSTPDTTDPTVTLVSPSANSEIARTTPIVVDVTDEGGLAAVFVWIDYPVGPPDLVHTGDAFTALFAGGSTRSSITDGYRFTLRREGGWPYAPTVRIKPVDGSGNTP